MLAIAGFVVLFAEGWIGTEGDEPAAGVAGPAALETRSETAATGPQGSPGPEAGTVISWAGQGFRVVILRRSARARLYDHPGGEGAVKAVATDRSEFGSPRVLAVVGRRGAWLEVTSELASDNRPLWVRANPGTMRFKTTPFSIHASLGEHVAELRQEGEVLLRFPVTVGRPDSPTPKGRFAVTDVVVAGLDPAYGCCALALTAHQPDLPLGWPGGDRIAIHGTTAPIGEAASGGCLRAEDEVMDSLVRVVPLGTPVFITN